MLGDQGDEEEAVWTKKKIGKRKKTNETSRNHNLSVSCGTCDSFLGHVSRLSFGGSTFSLHGGKSPGTKNKKVRNPSAQVHFHQPLYTLTRVLCGPMQKNQLDARNSRTALMPCSQKLKRAHHQKRKIANLVTEIFHCVRRTKA